MLMLLYTWAYCMVYGIIVITYSSRVFVKRVMNTYYVYPIDFFRRLVHVWEISYCY
jgi:hypothetical protein